jgi:HAD superfamily hydrolase (TIGR01509 family)
VARNESPKKIRLVIFDLDGTITRPYLDFQVIRKALGNDDPSLLTLDFILGLPPDAQKRAWEIMNGFEDKAAANAEPQDGAIELLHELSRRGVRTAIFTRNSRKSVETVLNKFGVKVDRIIARDDAPPKPDPTAIRDLMRLYGAAAGETVMVGDFALDVEAGKRAGVATVLLHNGDGLDIAAEPDYRINRLHELLEIIG